MYFFIYILFMCQYGDICNLQVWAYVCTSLWKPEKAWESLELDYRQLWASTHGCSLLLNQLSSLCGLVSAGGEDLIWLQLGLFLVTYICPFLMSSPHEWGFSSQLSLPVSVTCVHSLKFSCPRFINPELLAESIIYIQDVYILLD